MPAPLISSVLTVYIWNVNSKNTLMSVNDTRVSAPICNKNALRLRRYALVRCKDSAYLMWKFALNGLIFALALTSKCVKSSDSSITLMRVLYTT